MLFKGFIDVEFFSVENGGRTTTTYWGNQRGRILNINY